MAGQTGLGQVKDYLPMSSITVIDKDAIASGPKTSPSNHTAWLEQLESAQWQQRMRYQPESGGRQQGAQESVRQQVAQQPAQQAKATDANQAAGAQHQEGAAPESAAHDVLPAARTPDGAVPAAESRTAFGPGSSILQRTLLGGDVRNGQAWSLPRRFAAIDWQAQNAHVMAGAEGLRMWLRDARYEKGDGCKLLLELRARFARLGFRLAEFTLNGERVAESDQSGQSD
jgi:hypothetical protein